MPGLSINHIHLRAEDPRAVAEWWADAFGLEIVADLVRPLGDRFVVCYDVNGFAVNISGPRPGEALGAASVEPRLGLEHFCFDSEDVDADLARLRSLGAELLEGPLDLPASRICFVGTPDGVRVELTDRLTRMRREQDRNE